MSAAGSAVFSVRRFGDDIFVDSSVLGLRQLPFQMEEGVVWIEGAPFSRWLGHKRVRTLTALVERLANAGFLDASEFRRGAQRKSGRRGRPASALWFTRRAAVVIAARAETKEAIDILNYVVDVFEAVVDSCEGAASDAAAKAAVDGAHLRAENRRLCADNTRLRAENRTLRARVADEARALCTGTIGVRLANQAINEPLKTLARCAVGLKPGATYKGELGAVHKQVRREVGGFDLCWADLPVTDLGGVTGVIHAKTKWAKRDARAKAREAQLPLPLH